MPNNSSSNIRLAKNTIFLSVRMVIVLALSLYTTRVLLQVLGVEDYGVYNVVCGFVSMFTFLNTSMSNGIQRFFNYEYGKNDEIGANRVYCTAVQIQFLLAIIVIVLTESIGLWYLHSKMVIPDNRLVAADWIFQFSIVSFLFVIMQAPYTAAVLAHERMGFFSIVSTLDAVLKLVIVLILPHLNIDQLIMYGLLMAGINLVNFSLYYCYCNHLFPEIRLHRIFDRQRFRSMLSFSGWNLFGSFSGIMKEQGINLVMNFYFGPIVNAARGVAAQINSGMQGFVVNITMPVRPQVVQSYARGDLSRSMNLTYSISKISCCFLLMMAIPVSLEIDYILLLWLGNSIPEHTGTFAIIILFTSLVNNLNGATSGIVHATGIMKDYQLWGSLISMSSVPISYLLLRFYHIPELALICVLVCSALGHIVCLFVVRRLVGMPLRSYFRKVIWPIIIVFVTSLFFTLPFHLIIKQEVIRLFVVTFIGCTSVFLSLFFLAFTRSERQLFIHLAKSFANKIHFTRQS